MHFGEQLTAKYLKTKTPIECHFFLSDFLWDNIVGLPFFTPIHFKSSKIHVHSPLDEIGARKWLTGVCSPDFSPFEGLSSFKSNLSFSNPIEIANIGPWSVEALLTKHPLAPYPAAVWIFSHQSGKRIAISATAICPGEYREALVKKLNGLDVFIQSAIAPDIFHPSIANRFTFTEAVKLGTDLGAGRTFINGIHPLFNDQDLELFELELNEKAIGSRDENQDMTARFAREPVPFVLESLDTPALSHNQKVS